MRLTKPQALKHQSRLSPSMNRLLSIALAVITLAACAAERTSTGLLTRAETASSAAPALASNETVVVLNPAGWDSDKEGPAGCVVKAIGRAEAKKIRFSDGDALRAGLGPPFEESRAVWLADEGIATLMSEPVVRQRLATLLVRYVVFMFGGTQPVHIGDDDIGVAPGVLGVGWDHRTWLQAKVWDVKEARSAGAIEASIAGRNTILLFPPIPIITATEDAACDDLGRRLAAFFNG